MDELNAEKLAPAATAGELLGNEHLAALIHSSSKNHSQNQDRIVAVIQKNGREIYQISLREFKGRRLVDLRVHASNGVEFVATARGVTIKPQNLREIIQALEAAEIIAKQGGML